MARIILFMCACVFKNIIYLWAHLTQLRLCLFCLLSAGKRQLGEMCTPAAEGCTFAAWVLPGGAAIRLRCAGGICRFRGNSSNRNHSATGSLSMRTWVFLQTRISVPVCPPCRQWTQRGRAPTTCFAFSDNFAVPEDSTRCCGLLSPVFAGMVHGDVWRPAAARKQLRTSLATATRNMFTIWAIKTQNKEIISNPKGGGMASKERLYELWMLYYTKVRASAEELTGTPVVAAGPPVWTFWHWQGSTRSFSASFVLKAEAKGCGGAGFWDFLGSSSCLFTKGCRFGEARHGSLSSQLSHLNPVQ